MTEKECRIVMQKLKKPDLEKGFQGIRDYIEWCESTTEEALEKVETWNRDEEIQKLKKAKTELEEELYSGSCFRISEEQKAAIADWEENHIKEKHNGNSYAGAIGGRFSYIFTPTDIENIGYIKCNACNDSFCFQELE